MLKEFLQQHKDIPRHDILETKEYMKRTIDEFDGLVDFLRDPERFPNREINDAVTLMWRLIGNKDIPIALDQWGFPALSFAVLGDEIKRTPIFIMPVNFIDQVREDTVMQIGMVAYMASQARDYYSGALKPTTSNIVNRRARAFEAEALLTLEKMALEEGETLNWNEWQRDILSESPQGLASLSPGLNYKTPKYMTQNYRNN